MTKYCLILIILLFAVPLQAATYWVSPSGNNALACASVGQGLNDPGAGYTTIAKAMSCVSAGDTIMLKDGIYQGANQMIDFQNPVKAGKPGAPITLSAQNDGGAQIDGQGANRPVNLNLGNDWIVLQGFDAYNSVDDVIRIYRVQNVTVKRVCAWDAGSAGGTPVNNHVWDIAFAVGNITLEDTCGFGTGRKIYIHYSGNGPVYVRRAWAAWNGGFDTGQVSQGFTAGYKAYDGIFENVIGTVNGTNPPSNFAYGALTSDGWPPDQPPSGNNYCANSKYLGSIAYLRSGDTIPGMIGTAYFTRSHSCDAAINTVFDAGSTSVSPLQADTFDGGDGSKTCADVGGCNRVLDRVTTIGTAANSISSVWTVSNSLLSNTGVPTGANNIWDGSSGSGARLCYQYQNGTLTSTPLWPWPMDARINQALTRSGRNPATVLNATATASGGVGTITGQIESRYGTIPSACKGGGIPPPTQNVVLAMPLDAGSGAVATDISGNNNNGTIGPGVTWDNSGKYGKALSFDGTGTVVVADAVSLNLSNFTIEMWLNPATTQGNAWKGAVTRYGGTGSYYLYQSSTSGSCAMSFAGLGGFSTPSGYIETCDTANIPTGTWSHNAITFNGTTLTYIRDGVVRSSTAASVPLLGSDGTLYIGGSQYGEFFNGKIDEVRIKNYAAPLSEIQTDMKTPLNPVISPSVKVAPSINFKIGAATQMKYGPFP